MKQLYCERDSIQNEIDRLSGSQPDVDYIKKYFSGCARRYVYLRTQAVMSNPY